ncbi:hypothetical protein [Desulfurella sp.]|uniref:hypothetical protein n=1 Tax=Desulfurella sp. TaxID=1962857 RepID=UPI003D0D8845
MLRIKKYVLGTLIPIFIVAFSYFNKLPNANADMFINMVTPRFAFNIGSGLNAYYTPSVPGYVYYYSYNNMYYMWYNGILMYSPYYWGPWKPVYTGMIIPRIFLSGPPHPPPGFKRGYWVHRPPPPPPPPPIGYYVNYWYYVPYPPAPPPPPPRPRLWPPGLGHRPPPPPHVFMPGPPPDPRGPRPGHRPGPPGPP